MLHKLARGRVQNEDVFKKKRNLYYNQIFTTKTIANVYMSIQPFPSKRTSTLALAM